MALRAPCFLVTLVIHPRLREKIFVALQRALRLQKLRPIRTRVYVNQRVALRNALTFRIVDANDYSCDLGGNRRGVNRSDGADRVQINTDIAFLRRRSSDGDAGGANLRGRGFFCFFVMVIEQEDCNQQDQDCQAPPNDSRNLMPRW